MSQNGVMAGSRLDITRAALALPEGDRLALATQLLDSLHGPEDEDAEGAWLVEAARRIREVNEGSVKTLSTEEVLGGARAAVTRR